MLSDEVTNPVFNDIASGASHTYSQRRKTPSCNTRSAGTGQAVRAPHLRTQCSSVKTFFNIMLFRVQPKKLRKKLIAVVFSRRGLSDFLATPLLVASFG